MQGVLPQGSLPESAGNSAWDSHLMISLIQLKSKSLVQLRVRDRNNDKAREREEKRTIDSMPSSFVFK